MTKSFEIEKGGEKMKGMKAIGLAIFSGGLMLSFASSSFAQVSLRGNPLFAGFFGRNNFVGFFVRNIEISASGGFGYFFATGSVDIEPISWGFWTGTLGYPLSRMQSYANTVTMTQNVEFLRVKEAFVSTRSIRLVRVRLGRMFARLSAFNEEKFWQRAFVERPLTFRQFFGIHGFLDEAIEISVMPPLPWKLEVSFQLLDGDSPSWGAPGSFNFVYLVYMNNTFGTEQLFGGFDIYFATGPNSTFCQFSGTRVVCQNLTDVVGGTAFFSWYPYFRTRVGYILRSMQGPGTVSFQGGIIAEFSVRPVRVFEASLRPEFFGVPNTTIFEEGGRRTDPSILELTVAGTFYPDDIVRIRLQGIVNAGLVPPEQIPQGQTSLLLGAMVQGIFILK